MPLNGMRHAGLALATGTLMAMSGVAAGGLAHAATGTLSLVTLPDNGENAIYNFVNSATSSVDVTIYELKDLTLENDLVAREKAGVNVRVIMDQAHKSYDAGADSVLTAGGVGVVWSSTAFTYTHQKTITVDNDKSYVSSGNFDTTFYATSRDFGVLDTDSSDVAAIVAVFNADYAHTSITPSDGDNLVWSPTDSQTRLLSVINGAQHTLDVEQEEFSDTALVNAIVADENRGVAVRVVVEDPSSYTSELNQVTAAGGKVTGYSSSTGYYIHAKTVIADSGSSTAKAFVGSENFSSNSLNNNRELGLITTNLAVAAGLESAFAGDFTGSDNGKVAIFSPGTQTSPVGSSVSLQIQGEDTCTGTLSYSATGLPAGLSISSSTGVISGTATTAGTSTVKVTGKDSTGPTGSATFTWTVGSTAGNTVTVTNPGSQTGTVATAASLQISATDSASGQTLTYSATGLPAGLSVNSGTGLISGTPTTAADNNVTVKAADTTGASGSASFTWDISTSGGGGTCTSQQLLGNPGFETGTAAPWTASSGVISDHTQEPPHSGTWDAWLDGYTRPTTNTLSQTVSIPAGCASYGLSFWLHIDTGRTTTTAADTMTVQIVSSSGTVLGTLATFSNLNAGTGYTQHSYNLAAYAGQTVTLTFTGKQTSDTQTSFVVDDTALNVS